MEITQENITRVANGLESRKFNSALQKVQDYTEIAKSLMEKYPDASLEELCDIFEREQLEMQENIEKNGIDSMNK